MGDLLQLRSAPFWVGLSMGCCVAVQLRCAVKSLACFLAHRLSPADLSQQSQLECRLFHCWQ